MKTISLTVPMDYNALTRASDMLHGLAIDLSKEQPGVSVAEHAHGVPEPVATVTETASPAPAPVAETQPEAARVFSDPNGATVASVAEQPADPVQPAATVESATIAEPATAAVDKAPAHTNPAVMVPWDARINSGTPTKLAKAPNNWKLKRGVDKSLVATVEAELIQAMQASPANPVEPTPAPVAETATPTPAPVEATPATQAVVTPAQPAAAGGVSTFPELMAEITSKGIDQATVLAAVNKQGLQALPLLATRPDLIPAVAAELGV